MNGNPASLPKDSEIQQYDVRAKALRHHPMVEAWIKEYYTAFVWREQPPDCRHCSYPHSPNLLCGGATFGALSIGGELYYVDWSNVCYFVQFREKERDGFHWRHDRFFRKTPEGIEVVFFTQYNNTPQEHVWRISRNEWKSIVTACREDER